MPTINTVIPPLDSPTRRPRFGYNNILTVNDVVSITASSESAGYLHQNAYDGKEYTYWMSGGAGTTTLTVMLSLPHVVDYFALYGHNFHEVGTSITLQYDNGGGWTDLASIPVPGASVPILAEFASVNSNKFRLVVVATAAFRIGILHIGKLLTMERGCWNGQTPPWMGRSTEVLSNVSQNGVLLGRSVRRLGLKWTMSFDYLTTAFVRTQLMPFLAATETMPFFVQWNPIEYPDDIAFAWVENPANDISYPRYNSHSLMSFSISMKGRI